VSFPSWELFAEQDEAYRQGVMLSGVPRVSVEAGATFGWAAWAQASVGIDHFGASAPGAELMQHFGITADHVVETVEQLLG
jgi:transketolase